MTMLYFLLPYGNICSLIRLFYKLSYIFMFRKIVRRCAFTRIRPQLGCRPIFNNAYILRWRLTMKFFKHLRVTYIMRRIYVFNYELIIGMWFKSWFQILFLLISTYLSEMTEPVNVNASQQKTSSNSTAYVSNLPFVFTNTDIHKIFDKYGKIIR